MAATGSDWVLTAKRVPVRGAADLLPRASGFYAVFINDLGCLLASFGEIAVARSNPHLLYIGQASGSLYQRVWMEECQHKRPGTFFRSIGVMLGYESPTGGKSFEFKPPDKSAVAKWIAEHLSVAWTADIGHMNDEERRAEERSAILRHCPLLNIIHNPKKIAQLKELRARSQQGVKNAN